MLELSITLTNECNYNCNYCFFYNDIKKKFNIDNLKLLNNYNLLLFDRINILGGELGLLTKEELDLIFNYFKDKNIPNNKIYIFTNGLFLEKYLEYYKNRNYNYQYHILNSNLFEKYYIENIEYIFIVDSIEKIDQIINLANKHNDIIFNISIDKYIKEFTDEFCSEFKKILNLDNIIISMPGNILENFSFFLKKSYNNYKKIFKLYKQLYNNYCNSYIQNVDLY
jgi:hypothetical protein